MSKITRVTSIDDIINLVIEHESDSLLLVIDENIKLIYPQLSFSEIAGKTIHTYISPAGENCKSMIEVESACEYFLEHGVNRNFHLIAIGGGACSDFAGLVASMLLRGISWSVVPTTLLSMIDASIGGKVAVNSKSGKNLIGAFHLPTDITICEEFLNTLPEDEFISGLGELAKYFLLDHQVHELISKQSEFDEILKRCADYKQEIVEEDFKEGGLRKVLNLGHTLGHAIERMYELPHGVSVFLGMKLIFNAFEDKNSLEHLENYAQAFGLSGLSCPWEDELDVKFMIELVSKDKKMKTDNTVEVILIEEIGKPIIKTVTLEELANRVTTSLKTDVPCNKMDMSNIKSIKVPSSKSFANRALVLAALYPQDIQLLNLPPSTDVSNMIKALTQVGLKISEEGDSVTILGSFPDCEILSEEIIDISTGDGGTTNRFLIPLLALGKNTYNLIPSEKMFDRPMDELEHTLKSLGVQVERDERTWFKLRGPLTISQGVYEVDCTRSTQFATGLAMSLSPFDVDVEPLNLVTSRPYWEMTLNLIERFKSGEEVFETPADFSSLGYPLVWSTFNEPVLIENCKGVDRFQADSSFISLLESLGGVFDFSESGLYYSGPKELRGFEMDCRDCPDLIPTLCFLASYSNGSSKIKGVEVLVHKESDRLQAVIDLFNDYDIQYELDKENDELTIHGRKADGRSVDITPPRDHRMVMVSYLYQKINSGGVLENQECVGKSFPSFFEVIG